MSRATPPKTRRNDPCLCKSGYKFKLCCGPGIAEFKRLEKEKKEKLYVEGHDIQTYYIQTLHDWFKKQPEFDGINVIDITRILTPFNWRFAQMTHYNKDFGPTVMLAERTRLNDLVFKKRSSIYKSLMIMFRGAYIPFNPQEFPEIIPQLKKMIEIRMQDDDDDTKDTKDNDDAKHKNENKEKLSNQHDTTPIKKDVPDATTTNENNNK